MRSDGRIPLKLDAATPLIPNGSEKFLQQAIRETMSSLSDVTQGLLGKVLQGPFERMYCTKLDRWQKYSQHCTSSWLFRRGKVSGTSLSHSKHPLQE